MAYTARDEADCKEFFDDAETLKVKIQKLADLIRNSKHFCAFTGAGISTSAGIADFRSGINTVLDTGAGAWAAQAARKQGKAEKQIKKNRNYTSTFEAIPTACHMALVSLMTTGPKYLKCTISQNTDGLHRRSGIPPDQLCELHGNSTLEVCDKCGRGYMRDYRCRGSLMKQKGKEHQTGRLCTVPNCGGNLEDTIINFGERLPIKTFETAREHTDQCDVMLAMGSSLQVRPASDLPFDVGYNWREQVKYGQNPTSHLVIINLQKTPFDKICSLRIFAKIDDVMVPLMKELGLEIPEWKLNRFMRVRVEPHENRPDLKKMVISAVDIDGIDATVFEDVKLSHNGNSINLKEQPNEREAERALCDAPRSKQRSKKPKKSRIKVQSNQAQLTEEQEARRALRDAQRAKLRMALKANKMEHKKRELLVNGDTESISKQNKTIKKSKRKKLYESGEKFQFEIESKMMEIANNGDDQKENENGSKNEDGTGLVVELSFFGNYGEPNLRIPLQPFLDNVNADGDDQNTLEFMCRMVMDIESTTWNVEPYSCPPYDILLQRRDAKQSGKPKKSHEQWLEEKEDREAMRKLRDAHRTEQRLALKAGKMGKSKEQLKQERAEREAKRDAQRALRDAQRAKQRLALKARKIERKRKAKALLDEQSKEDGLNLSNGNQPEGASTASIVIDGIELPKESDGVEVDPEDDTAISPVHRRPSDDTSPNPYRAHLSEYDITSTSNDVDLVSGDQ